MGALQNILKFGKSIVDNIEGNNNGGVPSPVVTQNRNIPQAPIRIAQPQAMPQFNNMNVQPLMTPQMIQRFQPAPINDNNFISRNIINPVVNDVESIYHPIAAGLAGAGGLVRIGGNALIGNQQAEQRAIQQTNQAIANQLNNPKSGLTYKDATSGNAGQLAKSFAKEGIRLSTYVAAPGVGKVAENAVAPSLLSRAGKGALQFGALNAGSTAAQEGLDGHINPTDVAKSFGMGAVFGGGLPILHDVAGSVGKSIIGDIKPVEAQTPEMAMNHLNDQFNQLDNQRTNMINQGLDDNHPDMVNNFKQMTDVYNQQEALANQHLQPTSQPPVAPQVGKTAFQNKTEIDQINRILDNKDTVGTGQKIADYYRTAKGEDWQVVKMSPDEYLDRAAKAMGQDPATWKTKPMGNVDKYAQDMTKGDKFPMPWVNEVAGSQEGRTRALAAKKLGIKEIDVAVATKPTPAPQVGKTKQLETIKKLNPMTDEYHTGIRTVNDIKTYQEAFNDPESFAYPDFTKAQGQKALEKGKITVYSSKPLDNNTAQFVTPSKMAASDYAGSGKVYSKEVSVNDVAWINGDEGQLTGNGSPVLAPQVGKTQIKWKNTTTAGNNILEDMADPQQKAYRARAKGEEGAVVRMTPDEYIESVRQTIPESSRPSFEDFVKSNSDVPRNSGGDYDMPYINKVTGNQDGMHRAVMAKNAGASDIPVLVVDKPGTLTPAPQVETPKPIKIAKPKTGIVDAKLQALEKQRKEVVNDIASQIKDQNPKNTLYKDILRTGISPTERGNYPNLPTFLLKKGGMGLDELSMFLPSENENELYLKFRNDPEKLYDAIMDVKKPLKASEIKQLAEEQLASGRHPDSEYFNQIEQGIADRKSELTRYPKGTYRQVKVIDKPIPMSEEEFAAYTNTPEGQMPFRPNEIKNNDSIRIRNPQAEAKILESLQNGETTDRILYDYMQTTGANMDTAVRDVDRVMRESGNQSIKSNPLRGTVSLPEATDVGQAHLNADLVTGQLNDARNIAKEAVANLNSHDLSLIKNIETKPVEIIAQSARNPQEFLKTVTKLRDYYDLRDAWDQYLGVDHGYRMNYLRQLVKQAETDIKQEPVRVGGGNKRVGYTNARSYQTLNTNVMDALDRESGATHNLGKLAYEKGLQHLYGDKISKGELLRGETGIYESVKTKYGKGLAASPEVAQELNSRAVPNKTGKVLNAFDKANAGIKYLKLGGGLFHGTTEAMNFLGQQLTSLETYKNPIEAARASARVISSTVNAAKAEKAFNYFREVKPGETISTMDKARLGGVTIYPKEILADVNVSLVDNLKSSNPIKMLHDAVFQREIPIQKLTIFEQATKGLNSSIPADLAKIREAANAVNHIFGGLNRAVDTHVLSPNNAKSMSRFLLATDFTEAKINTMRDALTRKGTQGNIARQAVLGKTLVAAAPGLIAYTALGQIDWSNPKDIVQHVIDQILDPHVSTSFNTKSGINKIAKTPETFISEFGRLITPLFADGPDKKGNELTAIQHYLTGRLAALPSTALQLGSNKDYFGNPVIERNGDGSIRIGQSARNLALQVAPIPIVQANTVYKTQRETPGNTTSFANSVLEAASNIAGFRTKADPNDPKMKSLNFQNQVVNGLSNQDKNAWNTVHGKVYDEYGNLKTTVTPADLLNKYTTELSNPTVLAADKKINDYKKLQGQPSDPFYDLTPEQQRTLLIIKTLKNVDRGDNAGTAKIMTERNQGWIDQYYKDSSTYYDKLNLPPSTKTRLIENPSVSPEVQKALDESKGLAGQDYYNYVIQHPELTEYYSNLDSVIRQQRDYYNEPQFKGYPVASDRVSQLLDASRSMAKSPERSAIFKDPEVSNFLADVAMWQLNQGASKARFEGQDYTQKDLKNIYSVGNYDIAKLANGQYAQTAGTLSDGTKLAGNGFTTGGSAGFTLGTAPAAGGYTKKPKVRKARKMYIKRNKVRMKNTHPKIRYTMPQQKPLKIQYGRTVEPIKIKM